MAGSSTAAPVTLTDGPGWTTQLGARLRRSSLQRTLAGVVLFTTVSAVTVAAVAFAVYDSSASWSRYYEHRVAVADLVAASVAPALGSGRAAQVTDVLGGLEAGLRTFLVLTGVTSAAEVDRYPYLPSQVVASVADLIEYL